MCDKRKRLPILGQRNFKPTWKCVLCGLGSANRLMLCMPRKA